MIDSTAAAGARTALNPRRIFTFPRTRSHVRAYLSSAYRLAPAWWAFAVAAFVLQGMTRGKMDNLGFHVYGSGLERSIFGGLPTLWLQDHLYDRFPGVVAWFSIIVHGSWFAVPWIGIAFVTWKAPRRVGSLFVAIVALFALVLPMFALVPMQPPWMASDDVTRVISAQLDRDIRDYNQFAAMPSMHVALPLLVAVWSWREGFRRAGILMFAYTLLVGFEVVIAGEHYVVDAIGAAAVALLALAAGQQIEHRSGAITARLRRAPPRASARGEAGQNLLEFALLAPFVLLFIGAIVVFGLAFNTRSSLQQAVREGARQAAVGKTLTQVQDLASSNAPEVLDPADIAWCHPVGTSGTKGRSGDPVVVYIWTGGQEGYEYTIAPAAGILNVVGLNNLAVRMSPEAKARLEKSVATPVDCPAGVG